MQYSPPAASSETSRLEGRMLSYVRVLYDRVTKGDEQPL